MLQIEAKTLPHGEQRYNTCGDYFGDTDGVRHFRISELGDDSKEFCILLHELIESYLCSKSGISDAEIDTFDKTFEAARKEGNKDEPGDDANSPYYKQHQFASNIERMMALELGINWKEYSDQIENL